jgi:formylglycine-generating enzyme required for sulfatase activity
MRRIVFQIIFSVLCLSSQAQNVSNIRAEQRGQDIVVLYALETSSPCEVSLLLSQDNGCTWSAPLKNVSGDVGKNISAGEKQIIWEVLEERDQLVGDLIKFKVFVAQDKSIEIEMVFVAGGDFIMGGGDQPERPFTLSSFFIGKYEVTQAQYNAIMGNKWGSFRGCNDCPVESISWNHVQQFIQKFNARTGENYRLPTEAEWEYAARGGNMSKGYIYSGSNDINAVGWYDSNSERKTHPVGLKQSNELGIYDMTGNVWEFCSDWYNYYVVGSQHNPIGPSFGEFRVARGGSWFNFPIHTSYRNSIEPDKMTDGLGFRLVLSVGN